MATSDRLGGGAPFRTTVLAVAVAAAVAGAVTLVLEPSFGGGMGGPGRHPLAGLDELARVKVFLSTFNLLLLLGLGATYALVYRDLPNPFTLSLLLFTAALLLYALASNPVVYLLLGYRGGRGLGPFTFLPDAFAALAIVTLFYQSYR